MEENFTYTLDNSGTIYIDKVQKVLNERTGVFKSLDDEGNVISRYEHIYGISEWPEDEKHFMLDDTFPIIGKKGDKWDDIFPLFHLIDSIIRCGEEDFETMFMEVDNFFEVDKSKAEDTIWLEFDPCVAGTNHARCDIHSEFFTLGRPIFFDYTKTDDHFKVSEYNFSMKTVAAFLSACQDWLEKPLKVRVSFAYDTNPYLTEDKINKRNKTIRSIEERYAQPIEDYVNDALHKSLHKLDDWKNVKLPFELRMKERWHSERIPQEWWKKW